MESEGVASARARRAAREWAAPGGVQAAARAAAGQGGGEAPPAGWAGRAGGQGGRGSSARAQKTTTIIFLLYS